MVRKVSSYDEFINSNTAGKAILEISATWCGACKMLEKSLEQITDIPVSCINVDESADIANTLSVMSVPTIIAFNNGIEINRKVGVCGNDDIHALFEV